MNFARLNLNLRANHLTTDNNFMLGVGEKNKMLPFSISTSLEYLSTGGSIGDRDEGLTRNIQVVALDSFLRNHHIPNTLNLKKHSVSEKAFLENIHPILLLLIY